MRRVDMKSPVRENCTLGSVRGALGNWRPYLATDNGIMSARVRSQWYGSMTPERRAHILHEVFRDTPA